MQPPLTETSPLRPANRYDRFEWAGAFGDLGTLLPFVIAYVGVLKLDPLGVLLAFGVCMVASGLIYRTPFPVQPMKAIGAVATAQAAQTLVMTQAAVHAAGLVTGLLWLLLGLSGAVQRVARWVSLPVAYGVMLGLGAAFVLQGVKLAAGQSLLACLALLAVFALRRSRRVPAIFVVLLIGLAWIGWQQPQQLAALAQLRFALAWPALAWPAIGWHDLWIGAVFLALPQIPLTLGNAVVAVREENNRLFPDRPVTDRQVAVSTGAMNVFGSAIGGVPMCHGAGGMAGHVAFGARTGGSLVILGGLLLALALCFGSTVVLLFQLIPAGVLGAILVVTGLQLAAGKLDLSRGRAATAVTLVTALLSLWNIGLGFGAGLVLQMLLLREKRAQSQ